MIDLVPMDYLPEVGDLVRYIKDPATPPPLTSHDGNKQLGIVIEVNRVLVGKDPEHQSYMNIIRVLWADQRWNTRYGYSSEHPDDLIIIQSLRCKSEEIDINVGDATCEIKESGSMREERD